MCAQHRTQIRCLLPNSTPERLRSSRSPAAFRLASRSSTRGGDAGSHMKYTACRSRGLPVFLLRPIGMVCSTMFALSCLICGVPAISSRMPSLNPLARRRNTSRTPSGRFGPQCASAFRGEPRLDSPSDCARPELSSPGIYGKGSTTTYLVQLSESSIGQDHYALRA